MNNIYWSVITTGINENEEYHGIFKSREFAMKKVNRIAESMRCEAITFDHPLYDGEFRKVTETRVKVSARNQVYNPTYTCKKDTFYPAKHGWKWTGLYYIIEPVEQDN
ncbi:hypothetical protein N9N26_01280 [Candidatus Poseidoniales archaeon]|jgi:hypothetical protein|nr:hypothetical protein [Candidatus Poseidoniales archaeon]